MKNFVRTALVLAASINVNGAFAQQPANPIDAHLAAAKSAAEFDYTGTLARLCLLPQTAPGRDVAPGPAPAPRRGSRNRLRSSTTSILSAAKFTRLGRSRRARESS